MSWQVLMMIESETDIQGWSRSQSLATIPCASRDVAEAIALNMVAAYDAHRCFPSMINLVTGQTFTYKEVGGGLWREGTRQFVEMPHKVPLAVTD